ncbi:glycoside hydrolase family 5 protein [Tabrizicola sp.]|uniref:glycoside hydrolase family 5 protein n=1 Tax=Tabrizicola sp. TaxID=2005166 RepID=UPI003F3FBFB9
MIRSICIALALATALAQPASADPPVFKRGLNIDLWIDWLPVADMLAKPGYLDPYPDWRKSITPDMFSLLAKNGFDFVRVPVDPAPMLALGPGEAQDALIADMREGVEVALAAGLKVVVDMHPIPRPAEPWGLDGIQDALWPDYVTLIGRIATALDGLPPDRVAFELLNEPTIDCEGVFMGAPQRWPAMQADLHAAARKGAPDLALVLTGACWSQAGALKALDPTLIPDDNVIWTFHSYSPYVYTHQGAMWAPPPAKYIWDLPYPPSLMTPEIAAKLAADAEARMMAAEGQADAEAIAAEIKTYSETPDRAVADDIAVIAAWADTHGIPRNRVLLGEFGALHTVDGSSLPREWYHAFLAHKRGSAEAAGMGWAVLGYAGGMGVSIDGDPLRDLAPETCQALGLQPCSD